MAVSNDQGVKPLSFIAGGSIIANRLVKLDSTIGQVVATSAITDAAIGVALHAASSGEPVAVQTTGIAKVTASATSVAVGVQVMPTASGAGKCVLAAGATALSCGLALATAGADGDIVEVLLATPNVNAPASS
jgi:hypothetical protein